MVVKVKVLRRISTVAKLLFTYGIVYKAFGKQDLPNLSLSYL